MNQLLYYSTLIGFVFSMSCNNAKKIIQDQTQAINVDTSDCYPNRKSQDTILLESAIIDVVGDSYFMNVEDNGGRFIPCNIPNQCKVKGLKVTCELIVKEIFPNERWLSTPALLKTIAIIKD